MSPLFLPELLPTLVIYNLVEPFNSSARLETIQVNKTPCSIHGYLPSPAGVHFDTYRANSQAGFYAVAPFMTEVTFSTVGVVNTLA